MSFACALHCLFLPVLITVLPLLGFGYLVSHEFDVVMLAVTLGVASLSLGWGVRIHKNRKVFILLGAAILSFSAAMMHEELASHAGFFALGGFFLVIGHILNRRLCKSCRDCQSCGG